MVQPRDTAPSAGLSPQAHDEEASIEQSMKKDQEELGDQLISS